MRIRELGLQPFVEVWRQMQTFTDNRYAHSEDELWLVEHFPVYTQGLAGKQAHLLNPGDIPVIKTDRGGQITYHGPGQLVMYLLLDLQRREIGIRPLVSMIEASVIELLSCYRIEASSRADAPGVYTADGAKIASLGLKVRKGCTYHGLSLNVDMDLSPFLGINPCGLAGMRMSQMRDYIDDIDSNDVGLRLADIFTRHWQNH